MPLNEINYQNTVIYKIQHTENDELLYVGHTTDFTKRKSQHKSSCVNEESKKFNIKLYKMIRDNGGWDMFKMIEIIKYPCNDRREAEAEEDRIIREMKTTMNTKCPIFDKEAYLITNKEKIREYKNKWTENNKEYVKMMRNTEDAKEYQKQYNKQYNESKKEIIKERSKAYNQSQLEVCQCQCGQFITKKTMGQSKHIQSKRHQEGIKSKV